MPDDAHPEPRLTQRISPLAKIGERVRLGDFVNIYGACRIGDEAVIGAFTEIQPDVEIGPRAKVSSHCFVCSGVVIEPEAFIGHGVMFANERRPRAVAADGRPLTHLDTQVEPILIRSRAAVGSGAVILGGVTIGRGAVIGAGAVVTGDVPDFALAVGVPAQVVRLLSAGERNVPPDPDHAGLWAPAADQRTSSAKDSPMSQEQLIQTHNQTLLDDYRQKGPVRLGPYISETWRRDPKHVFITMARYKFAAKMLAGKDRAFEIGCGDGLGATLLLQSVKTLCCYDLEPLIIADAQARNEMPDRLSFEVLDVMHQTPPGVFSAAVSIDVLEHVPASADDTFMAAICRPLSPDGVAIIGTPNAAAAIHASKNSQDGHINLKSHDELLALLRRHFHNVFLFSMNDEVVHTGYYPMAHYFMALCSNPKKDTAI